MARATMRTNVALGILALLFVMVIIILCLVPRPCKGPDCMASEQESMVGDPQDQTEEITLASITTKKYSLTEPPTTKKLTTPSPSSATSKESTSTASTSTKSTSMALTSTESTSTASTSMESTSTASTSTESTSTASTSTESTSAAGIPSSSAETTEEQFFRPTSEESSTSYGPHSTSPTTEGSSPVSSATEESTELTEKLSSLSSTTSDVTSNIPTQQESTTLPSTTEDHSFSSLASEESTTVASTKTIATSDTTEGSTATFSAVTERDSTSSTAEASTEGSSSLSTEEISSMSEQSTEMFSTTSSETSSLPANESSATELSTATTELLFTASDVCKTTTCKWLASRMLSKMDLGDVNPCEDFYQYSCGGVEDDPFLDPESQQLLAENLIKERLMIVNRSDSLLGPVRVFYDSCVNYVKNLNATYRLEQTRNVFSSLGYEFQDENLIGFDKVNLTQLLAKMMKMHFTPFFDVLLDVDSSNTSMFAFKLVPPLFTSPFSDDLAKATCLKLYHQRLEEARLKKITVDINKEYDNYTHCMLEGRGLEVRLERMEDAVQSMKLMEHISNVKLLVATRFNTNFFLESLVKFLPRVPKLRMGNLKKNYQEFTIAQLDEMGTVFSSSAIVWKDLMEELLGETVDPSSTVQVYFQRELDDIMAELELEFTQDAKNLLNMLLLMWSERIYTDLVKPVGSAIDSPQHCYRVTTSLMEDFTSYLYLTALSDLDSKQEKIKKMIKQEKEVAHMELKKTFGSDSDVVRKMQMMSGEVADLDETSAALQANMQGITLNDNFIENSKTLMERYRTLMYSVYRKSPESHQVMWSQFLLPYSPYGMTSYALNKFLIPYAALEAPLFYNDAPDYINYAGIGHMIAHEIAHGFDGTGLFYNGIEKKKMDSLLAYVGATEHLQEMLFVPWTFNSSSGLTTEFRLYPGLALNEVLADSAANRLAWESYLAEVTSALITTTEAAPETSGRGRESRRKRSLDLYPSGSLWSTRKKRQTLYLPSLESPEPRLPWLELTPAQLYFLRIAQNHCSGSSDINMLTVMENEHLPPRLRVNLVLKNDPLFAEAFKCQFGSGMKPGLQIPFILG